MSERFDVVGDTLSASDRERIIRAIKERDPRFDAVGERGSDAYLIGRYRVFRDQRDWEERNLHRPATPQEAARVDAAVARVMSGDSCVEDNEDDELALAQETFARNNRERHDAWLRGDADAPAHHATGLTREQMVKELQRDEPKFDPEGTTDEGIAHMYRALIDRRKEEDGEKHDEDEDELEAAKRTFARNNAEARRRFQSGR